VKHGRLVNPEGKDPANGGPATKKARTTPAKLKAKAKTALNTGADEEQSSIKKDDSKRKRASKMIDE
jgi:hypothetical protein